jgi:hypothetical protein
LPTELCAALQFPKIELFSSHNSLKASNFGVDMRATGVLFVYLLGVVSAFGQLAEPLFFREKVHDFGEILEQLGKADYEFVFTNNSGRPVRIISVQASCGCTTPGWTQEVVAPGKTGFIKASYDPKGRPGYFNKSLTVTTDLSGTPITLQIKGAVVDKLAVKDESLTSSNGNLKLKSSSFNVGKVFVNKEATISEFAVVNTGNEPISFSDVIAPAYIQVTPPKTLAPGARDVITIKYDAKLKKQYGFQVDNIELKTSDLQNPIKSFPVYATLEEFFPSLSAEELAKSPALVMERYEVNFFKVKKGVDVENPVSFQNKGKKNLELHYIQSNCTCVVANSDKQVLKPGETANITIKFITAGRTGSQNKAITIYSNDPRNPVQRVTITGIIED